MSPSNMVHFQYSFCYRIAGHTIAGAASFLSLALAKKDNAASSFSLRKILRSALAAKD